MISRRGESFLGAVVILGGAWGIAAAEEPAGLQARISAAEYEVAVHAEGYQAPNRTQGFRTTFTAQGIRVVPRTGIDDAWEWGLAWIGYGTSDRSLPIPAATLAPQRNRIEYRRGPHTEWYDNTPEGLEQGFFLAAPPAGGEGGGLLHLDLALTGTLSPMISEDGQQIDFVEGTGKPIVRYAKLIVTDAAGSEVPAWMEGFSGEGLRGIRLVLDASDALFPLTVDPLVTTPAWTRESDQATAELGRTVATAGDVNGDGYSDLLVAAPFFDNGQADEGRVFVFVGSIVGLQPNPAWTAESDQAGARFGAGLGTAGDVNGDGFSDVIVGAPLYDNGQTDEGRIYVYLGSATGLAPTPAWTKESDQANARLGTSVGTAGDVNGDGFSDVIAGAPLYDSGQTDEGAAFVWLGSASGLAASPVWSADGNQASAQFGWSVATAGDVDGDGRADVLVGCPLCDNGSTDEGRAFLYAGTATGVAFSPSWAPDGGQAGAQFGWSVGTAGDVQGDGYADLIVGAWQYSNGQSFEGRAFVFLGGAGGASTLPLWTGESDRAEAYYGWSVGTAGDVNGDGYADIIVAAPFYFLDATTGGGQAYVYLGSPSGIAAAPEWSFMRTLANAAYGYSVATAGDVNGDGFADFAVGAPWDDNGQTNEGIVYVYLGAAGQMSAPAWTDPNQAGAHLGQAVAPAGDVNGDGYGDFVVGAPGWNNAFPDAGKAYLFLGAPGGILATSWSPEGTQEDAELGYAVASAGDVNGDGYDDVLIGTPLHDANVGENAGKAELYLGSPMGLASTPIWTKEGGGFEFRLGTSLGTAGDVNGDGFADVIVGVPHDGLGGAGGQALLFLGSPSGLPQTAWWALSSAQPDMLGYSVGTAGDVNRDGYSDIVVGAPAFSNGQVNEGRAFLYLGSPDGPVSSGWIIESNGTNAFLGQSIAAAGDVNFDGYGDVIVGVPAGTGSTLPHVRIYHGSATGLPANPTATLMGSAWGAHQFSTFGSTVASAGDVNGDGYADVVIGSPYHVSFGGTQIYGRAFVTLGSATGLSPSYFFVGQDDQQGSGYGWSVASAGDTNGDGYADVIIGSYLNTHGESQEGRAFIYKGNGETVVGGIPLNPRQRHGDDSAPVAHLGASSSASDFRLAALGRTPFGRARVKLEWEVRRLGTPLLGTPTGAHTSPTDTGVSGAALAAQVTGLLPSTPYHWRVRLRYDPSSVPFATRSRWLTVPWGGIREWMLRTGTTTSGAGRVQGLVLAKSGTNLHLTWPASCVGTDGDYEVYEGVLGSYSSHVPVVCTTGGTRSASFTPGALNRYYLVVPHNGTSEGSYGTGQGGVERSASASACRPRQVAACP